MSERPDRFDTDDAAEVLARMLQHSIAPSLVYLTTDGVCWSLDRADVRLADMSGRDRALLRGLLSHVNAMLGETEPTTRNGLAS